MALYGGINIVGKPDLENVRRLDLLPMPCINEMSRVGMAIDKEWLGNLSAQFAAEMDQLRYEICSYIPPEKLDEFIERSNMDDDEDYLPMNVNSADQLATLLFDVLGVQHGHSVKATKSGGRASTGKKELEKFKRNHPIVPNVLEYREVAKLKSTYADALPLLAVWDDETQADRIHAEFPTTRANTGRLTSKNPNLQNIPVRSERGRKVRAGFIASPGMEYVFADFGQFEMRLGAHYSKDANLVRIFSQGLDPHTDTAMRAFQKSKQEVESETGKMLYRAPCKNVNFGIFYGLTPQGLYDLMMLTYATAGLDVPDWLTLQWCEQFIADWFKLYEGVNDYIENQYYRARRYRVVWTLLGRVRRVPEVRSVHKRVVAAGLRQAGNMPIQGTQADLNKIAIAEIYAAIQEIRTQGVRCWPVVSVHDEFGAEIEQGYGELLKDMMEDIMSRVMVDRETGEHMLRVPIVASGKVSQRWSK